MFGMGFGELVVVIVLAILVIGPRDLPKVLGKLGRWAGQMRRMASDLRHQSGIDEVLRTEGIGENLNEIRKLARGELDQITHAAKIERSALAAATSLSDTPAVEPPSPTTNGVTSSAYDEVDLSLLREREYPREGADSYGALPDTAFIYTETFSPSALASDPLYRTGDPDGIIPPEPLPEPNPPETQQQVTES
jgi:sec-independent protein translocase protein TatB